MQATRSTNKKSFRERVLHAILFEVLGILIFSPVISVVMGTALFRTGMVTLLLSSVAMIWNVIYSSIFERLERAIGFERSLFVRVLHALFFEGGLALIVIPVLAFWFSQTLAEAFVFDLGLLAAFLPYTLAFNWVYDLARPHFRKKFVGQGTY